MTSFPLQRFLMSFLKANQILSYYHLYRFTYQHKFCWFYPVPFQLDRNKYQPYWLVRTYDYIHDCRHTWIWLIRKNIFDFDSSKLFNSFIRIVQDFLKTSLKLVDFVQYILNSKNYCKFVPDFIFHNNYLILLSKYIW